MLNQKLRSFIIGSFLVSSLWSQQNEVPSIPYDLRTLPENFKENYSSPDYDYTDSVSLLTQFKYWFIELLSSWFNSGAIQENPTDVYQILTYLKYIFFFAVIITAVYFIIKMTSESDMNPFVSKSKKKFVNGDEIESQIDLIDFNEAIKDALQESDFRLAIKLRYYQLLKKLDDKKFIEFVPQKTSNDYLIELESSPYDAQFTKAVYYFTYIWYGEFQINKEDYDKASGLFVDFLNQIKNG